MIVIVKKSTPPAAVEALTCKLRDFGVDVHISQGSVHTVLGLVGDTSKLDIDQLKIFECVEDVKRIQVRMFQPWLKVSVGRVSSSYLNPSPSNVLSASTCGLSERV